MLHDPACTKSGVYWSWNGGPREGRGAALDTGGQITGAGGARTFFSPFFPSPFVFCFGVFENSFFVVVVDIYFVFALSSGQNGELFVFPCFSSYTMELGDFFFLFFFVAYNMAGFPPFSTFGTSRDAGARVFFLFLLLFLR